MPSIEMTPKDRLNRALALEQVDRPPVAEPFQTATFDLMHSSGSHWPEAHRRADKMASLSWEAHRVIGFESVRIPFDINAEAEAMGCTLDWSKKDVQPVVLERPFAFDEISIPEPNRDGRMPIILEAARELSARADRLPVIVGALGPLNIAVQLRGAESFLMDLVLQPEESHRLLDICQETALHYMQALDEVADVITVIEATSSPDLIGPREFRTFSKPRLRKVIEKREVPCILHICGRTQLILEEMVSLGAEAIGIDSMVEIAEAKRLCGGRCAVAGNVSATGSLSMGTPQEVVRETRDVLMKGSDIPCTSCGIAPGTPTENLKAMTATVLFHDVTKN